jgi:hypothetical protein
MTSYPTVPMILMIMKAMTNEEMDRDISHTLQLQAFVLEYMLK